MTNQTLYGIRDPWGEFHDLEAQTSGKALQWYDSKYGEMCQEDERGSCSDTIQVVGYVSDDVEGVKFVSSKDEEVFYDYERSDYEEHNTHWGVL